MCASEAYMRMSSYPVVQMSHTFYTLSLHDEMGQSIVVEEGQEEEGLWKVKEDTRLTAFFKLCQNDAEARELTYDQVPYKFRWVLNLNGNGINVGLKYGPE